MFLDFLLAQHVITEFQYNRVMAELDHEYHGDITAALVGGGISEDVITQQKASFYRLPYIKLSQNQIVIEALKFIPEDVQKTAEFLLSLETLPYPTREQLEDLLRKPAS